VIARRPMPTPSGPGILDQLLCNHLLYGVVSQPLDAVIHICRAALTAPAEAFTDPEETRRMATELLATALRLRHPTIIPGGPDGSQKTYEVTLKTVDMETITPWFGEYKTYVNPLERLEFEKQHSGMAEEDRVDFITTHLTQAGYYAMVADFMGYAFPIVQGMATEISKIINPEVFMDVYNRFYSRDE